MSGHDHDTRAHPKRRNAISGQASPLWPDNGRAADNLGLPWVCG
jgi:hypothetical protein